MAETHATETPAAESSVTAPAAATPAVALEAEADDWAGDSAVGEEDQIGSTASIGSSILKYRQENGRTYHAYKVILLVGIKPASY
jgi:hypothetical protein